VKHNFVVDENIFTFAAETDDAQGRTCANLLKRIGRNCHRIVANSELWRKVLRKMKDAERKQHYALQQEVAFSAQLLMNSEKMIWELDEAQLPEGLPIKDDDFRIVLSALPRRAVIVTTDEALRVAVNGYQEALGIRAITPEEAMELAQDR